MGIVEYQVSAGGDDGQWATDYYNTTGQVSTMGYSSVPIKIFARWAGVTIPSGATITNAYISFFYESHVGSPPVCALYFEKAANPTAIGSEADGNSRVKTTSTISIQSPSTGTWWNSADVSGILAELLGLYSYASGAAMQMIIVGAGTPSNYGSNRTYDYLGNIYGPKLHIEFTDAPSGCPRQAMHMRRLM